MSSSWVLTRCARRSTGPSKTGVVTVADTPPDDTGCRGPDRASDGRPTMTPRAPRTLRHPAERRPASRQLSRARSATGSPTRTPTTPSTASSTSTPSPSTSIPTSLRTRTYESALDLLAAGLDPDRCTLFVQSHVAEHTRLTWLLECTATMGELGRMTQFKEKSAGQRLGAGRPVHLPGPPGRRHPPLRRRAGAGRRGPASASRAGPRARLALQPPLRDDLRGARGVDPAARSTGHGPPASGPQDVEVGQLAARDGPRARRAGRDRSERSSGRSPTPTARSATTPRPSPVSPTCSSCSGWPPVARPTELAGTYTRYGELKEDLGEALVELLRPVRERRKALAADPGSVPQLLARGAEKARTVASATYARAASNIGLLPPD